MRYEEAIELILPHLKRLRVKVSIFKRVYSERKTINTQI